MIEMRVSFSKLSIKAVVVQTVTYFAMGLPSFLLLDYANRFAQPGLSEIMRQTTDPLVAAGPLFQVARGFLFALAFYPLRDSFFKRKQGWAFMWLTLVIIGVLSTFGPAPGSIEGLVYTTVPITTQLISLPEVVIQSLLFSVILCYWVDHDENKRLTWVMGIAFGLVVIFSLLGIFAHWTV